MILKTIEHRTLRPRRQTAVVVQVRKEYFNIFQRVSIAMYANTSQTPAPASHNASLTPSGVDELLVGPELADPMTEAAYWIAIVAFRICLNTALSVFSVISNVINATIFLLMGLSDGVASILLVLSISDGLFGLTGLIQGISSALSYLGPLRFRHSAVTIYNMLFGVLMMMNLVSANATVVLAVVRCIGVANPLRAKYLMTTRRQLLIILALSLPGIVSTIYSLSLYRMTSTRDPISNTTEPITLAVPDIFERVPTANPFRTVHFITFFVIINICLVILIVALKKASKFVVTNASIPSANWTCEAGAAVYFPSVTSPYEKIRRREARVIKSVVLVSALFTATNLPVVVFTILKQAIPGFSHTGYLWRSFDVFFMFCAFMGCLNSCVNIFIYFSCNTSYRKGFKDLFKIK